MEAHTAVESEADPKFYYLGKGAIERDEQFLRVCLLSENLGLFFICRIFSLERLIIDKREMLNHLMGFIHLAVHSAVKRIEINEICDIIRLYHYNILVKRMI